MLGQKQDSENIFATLESSLNPNKKLSKSLCPHIFYYFHKYMHALCLIPYRFQYENFSGAWILKTNKFQVVSTLLLPLLMPLLKICVSLGNFLWSGDSAFGNLSRNKHSVIIR